MLPPVLRPEFPLVGVEPSPAASRGVITSVVGCVASLLLETDFSAFSVALQSTALVSDAAMRPATRT